jgi:hypothetical protein
MTTCIASGLLSNNHFTFPEMKRTTLYTFCALGFALWAPSQALAWDYEVHRLINQLALASLPANFPAFVQAPAAAERIAFLSGEPDRWRNVRDLPLRHVNGPDHYIDLEELSQYGLTPQSLPVLRGDFIAQLALIRNEHPDNVPRFDPTQDQDHTRELVGLLPWAITEHYSKLKSCFSYLKTFEQSGGTTDEIANAQADVIYLMGVMGHYAGDASQPLHTTIHYRGWVGANPHAYTTDPRIHAWIDGGYFRKVGPPDFDNLKARLRPAHPLMFQGHTASSSEIFSAAVAFVVQQNKQVEPLYRMEKAGQFSGNGAVGLQGKRFLEDQLLKSAQFLGDLWYSAWRQAPFDGFLKGQLARRLKKSLE